MKKKIKIEKLLEASIILEEQGYTSYSLLRETLSELVLEGILTSEFCITLENDIFDDYTDNLFSIVFDDNQTIPICIISDRDKTTILPKTKEEIKDNYYKGLLKCT